MTKEEIIAAVTNVVNNTTSAGPTQTLTQTQLDEITDAVADELSTVNPTKDYPPVKL